VEENGIVVVLGAAGAIGSAVVRQCKAQGFSVLAADITEGEGIFACDVAQTGDLEHLAETIAAKDAWVRGLVNVVGRPGEGPLDQLTVESWDDVFAVNVRGPAMGTSRLLHLMRRGTSVVNFGSIASTKGVAERAAYCASKAAVIGLTKAAAVELAPRGIRVNAVCPGTIDTPWVERVIQSAPDPHQAAITISRRSPVDRMGSAEEVARCVGFLLSDASSFVTGACLNVGRSCRSRPCREEEVCHRPSGRYAPNPVIRSFRSDVSEVGEAAVESTVENHSRQKIGQRRVVAWSGVDPADSTVGLNRRGLRGHDPCAAGAFDLLPPVRPPREDRSGPRARRPPCRAPGTVRRSSRRQA
jgi:NAD(P)-dependent dehydrogenase (short-subunit alcohol dehydrogenase family)